MLENAPFLSEHSNSKPKFLGTGYYFWDRDMNLARNWGKKHYNESYFILGFDFEFDSVYYFDLLGSPEHRNILKELLEKFEKTKYKHRAKTLGDFFEFLKRGNDDERFKGIFPYKIIRAEDTSFKNGKTIKFSNNSDRRTSLDRYVFICVFGFEKMKKIRKRLVFNHE